MLQSTRPGTKIQDPCASCWSREPDWTTFSAAGAKACKGRVAEACLGGDLCRIYQSAVLQAELGVVSK